MWGVRTAPVRENIWSDHAWSPQVVFPTPVRAVLGTGLQCGPLIKHKNKQTPPSEQPPGSTRSRSVSPAPGRDRHRRVRARRWVGGSGGAEGGPGGVPEGLPRARVSPRARAAISAAPAEPPRSRSLAFQTRVSPCCCKHRAFLFFQIKSGLAGGAVHR